MVWNSLVVLRAAEWYLQALKARINHFAMYFELMYRDRLLNPDVSPIVTVNIFGAGFLSVGDSIIQHIYHCDEGPRFGVSSANKLIATLSFYSWSCWFSKAENHTPMKYKLSSPLMLSVC